MHLEREPTPAPGRPPGAPQEELDELLFTLEICRRALPWEAHPEHFERLRRIEGMVRWSLEGRWVYGPGLPPAGLRLDRPAWFAWLAAPTTTSFSYPLFDRRCGYSIGFMTVRKERRQRGGAYWTAYRRQGHRLRKIYLGASPRLTQARLEAAVTTLLDEGREKEGAKDTQPPQA